MTEPKKKRGRPAVNDPEQLVQLGSQISRAHGEALDRYIAENRDRPSKRTVLEQCIESLLKKKGYWPPPE